MFGTPFSLLQTLLGKRFLNLIFLFVLIGLGSTATTFDTKVSGQSANQSCPTCRPPTEQTIYAPLIKLNGSFNTEINLNCRSPYPIDVVPTFYTESGLPITGQTIRLAPAEMRFVDIRSLIPAQFLNQYVWGGVSLSYTGNLMEVWAQLTIRGVSNKGSANTLFAVVDARRSNTQQAVWRMPRNATATIAMGNYSNTPAGATLTFSNGDVEQVNLAPYATRVISRRNNGQNSTAIEAESVRVEASGQIGRLITTGVIVSNNGKYASSLRFYDRENTFQPNLYATNFRLKNSTPSIVLKNTTGGEITARPRFLPRTGEGSAVIELPAVTLPPNAVKELNLAALINAAATRPDLDSVAVQIINSGVKGSLIGAGNFTDDVTGVDYDIPLRDSGSSSRSAGGYPIRLDGDYSTILSLTNTGNVAGKFTLQINYAGGTYALYPQAVAAGATASFDFRQLRDRQTPDSSGRVLPLDFTIGQIRWSMVGGTATTLIGRSEIISKLDKVSSSYSCNICCMNSYQSSRLTPDQVFEFLGGTTQMTAMQKDRDCYNNYFAEYAVSGANWDSSDWNVVNVYNGAATALDVGSAMITASWETQYYLDNGSDFCEAYPVIAAPSGGMVVVPPTVTASFAVVGKNQTRTVSIQIANNPNSQTITFSIRRTQDNTGAAEFVGNSTTSANNQAVSFQIKGTMESDVKDNMILEAKVNNTVILNSKTFSVAKIKISRTVGTQQPADVTDVTTTTIVGERVKLNAQIIPSGISVSNQMWTIPPMVVKDFVVSSNNETGMKIDVDGLNTSDVNFAWVDGGGTGVNDFVSKEVRYDVTVDGQTLMGKSTFQVKRPVVTLATTTSQTYLLPIAGGQQLIFGDDSTVDGIVFRNTVSPMIPSGFAGTTQWVQIVNRSYRQVIVNGQTVFQENESGLDGCYPYEQRGRGMTVDSPFQTLPNGSGNFGTASVDDDYTMWLMYNPDPSQDGVWVPLKKVSWYWKVEAGLFGSSWAITGTSPTNPTNPPFEDTTTFPNWTRIVPTNRTCP